MSVTHKDPELRSAAAIRVTLVGAWVNVVLSLVKILVGVTGHSQALIADGIHSLSDLVSDIIVWIAARHASNKPDAEHPYGHGRFETLATLLLGIILILVALGLAWDAGLRLFRPAELLNPTPMVLYAALASILFKEWLYHYTVRVARATNSKMLLANAWHHRSDAISSVVVVIGVAGAMAGLTYLDAVAAVLVAVIIGKIGGGLVWESMQELVDKGLDTERLEAVRQEILAVGGVRNLHMLRTRSLGGHVLADVHLLVEPRISVSEGHLVSLLVEQRLKASFDELEDVIVHIDPEDDALESKSVGLPQRAEVEALLNQAWAGHGVKLDPDTLLLHYLNARVDIELRLKGQALDAEQLKAAIRHLPWLGSFRLVRVESIDPA